MNKKDLERLIREAIRRKLAEKADVANSDTDTEKGTETDKGKKKRKGIPDRDPNTKEKIKPKAEAVEEEEDDSPKVVKEAFKKGSKLDDLYTLERKLKTVEEQNKYRRMINEAPMRPEDEGMARRIINSKIRSGFSGEEESEETPFKGMEIFEKGEPDFKTLSRLSTEEFDEVLRNAREAGVLNGMNLMQKAMTASMLEQRHREALERLALDTVQRTFGVEDRIMEKIEADLKPMGQGGMDVEDDSGQDLQQQLEQTLEDDFTPEERELVKKYVDKRKFQNLLAMGAGYRSHKTVADLRADIEAIDPELFQLYMEIMPTAELMTWSFDPTATGVRTNMGKSELKFEEPEQDEEQDEEQEENQEEEQQMRQVTGAEASAYLFPILLHEIAKSVVEYIFAYSLEQMTAKMQKAVLGRADSYQEEHWMKLLGPRVWKYMHEAIDFIVRDRGNDYTLVSHLLYELGMLPPDEFLSIMDDILHDGPTAINRLEAMLDELEEDVQEYEQQNGEEPNPEDYIEGDDNTEAIRNALEQGDPRLEVPEERPEAEAQDKPLSEMNIDELNTALENSLEAEDYMRAAAIRDEINKRG
jgi:hypothetical protein